MSTSTTASATTAASAATIAGAASASSASRTNESATTMRAAVQRRYAGPDEIRVEAVPVPQPDEGEVVVEVHAAGVDRGVWHLATGRPLVIRALGFGLRRPKQPVVGTDVAGIVVAVGAGVTHLTTGDEVFGTADGSYAQLAVAHADRLARKPAGTSMTDAGAMPVSAVTAMAAVQDAAEVEAGQRVLVMGASGGVGSFAVQMAAGAGAHVTAVCSTRNVEAVRALGAHAVLDYTRERVTDLPDWFDAIVDNVGATPMESLHALTSPTGVVVPNSGLDGPDGGALMRVLRANARRALLRRRYRTFYSAPSTAKLERIGRDLASGALTPLIDSTLPLDRGSEAMARVASGHARGKVVVTP